MLDRLPGSLAFLRAASRDEEVSNDSVFGLEDSCCTSPFRATTDVLGLLLPITVEFLGLVPLHSADAGGLIVLFLGDGDVSLSRTIASPLFSLFITVHYLSTSYYMHTSPFFFFMIIHY